MSTNLYIAELLVRVFAGVLFLFQGYDKLFRIKLSGVIDAFRDDARRNNIPGPILTSIAYYTSLVEFFGGFLLLMGFMTNYTLYALGLDLILVAIAFSYLEPMWDLKHVFPRLALIIVLLLLPQEYRQLSFDHFFNLK